MPGGGADEHDPAVALTDAGPTPDGSRGLAGDAGDAAAAARKGTRGVRTGDVLGRYELGEELGEGGMATVYRARDRELRREVALKVLFPHLARRADIVHRFHREARAAAGLEHPNILRIYDVGGGEDGEPPYIVMELIRGRTLLQEIEQRGAMLAEVAACIGALLGDALSAAHAAGIVHRDVKPANVLIAPGGRLLLADFGVARLETEDSLVTRTGALLGTPAYMSPEQASGDLATTRSDLYSLGATLYQLATGALPYAGPPAKVMSLIAAGGPVAPVRRQPACGPDLSRFLERLMARAAHERPASATAIAGELRALAASGGLGDPSEELAAYFADPDGFLRARTPVVVGSLVAAANAAMTDDKLPRAMALADRASALAPDDPAVVALIRAVTEGGHASRRRRAMAFAGAALVVAGGATGLIWQLARGGDAASLVGSAAGSVSAGSAMAAAPDAAVAVAAAVAAVEVEAGSPPQPVAQVAAPIDAGAAEPAAPVGRVAAPSDARPVRPADRRPSVVASREPVGHPRDAGAAAQAVSAPPAEPVDTGASGVLAGSAAAPPELRPIDAGVAAAAAVGHVVVHNGLWCNIYVDGALIGNRRNQPLEVSAGHHVVRCVNPAGEWTQDTDVAAGATQTLTGPPIEKVKVILGVDATIDGKAYPRGAVVHLPPGRIEVTAGDKREFITFRVTCTLRDSPTLDCYP